MTEPLLILSLKPVLSAIEYNQIMNSKKGK